MHRKRKIPPKVGKSSAAPLPEKSTSGGSSSGPDRPPAQSAAVSPPAGSPSGNSTLGGSNSGPDRPTPQSSAVSPSAVSPAGNSTSGGSNSGPDRPPPQSSAISLSRNSTSGGSNSGPHGPPPQSSAVPPSAISPSGNSTSGGPNSGPDGPPPQSSAVSLSGNSNSGGSSSGPDGPPPQTSAVSPSGHCTLGGSTSRLYVPPYKKVRFDEEALSTSRQTEPAKYSRSQVVSLLVGALLFLFIMGYLDFLLRRDDCNSNNTYDGKWQSYNEKSSLEIRRIPQYVLDHAPLVHLYSRETFWPSHIGEHLQHVSPYIEYEPAAGALHYNLTNLHRLNGLCGNVFLQSDDNVEDRPSWLTSRENIPVPNCSNPQCGTPTTDSDMEIPTIEQFRPGRSSAPATLIVVRKPGGIVDAFWFFFYSYNLGNKVFVRFGNHVGDWEHTAVRFKNGKPHAVYYSEHDFGNAYKWEAVEKYKHNTTRPMSYSAVGTHAMYAAPGVHRYVLPFGLLSDHTDKGPLWDPLQNMYAYDYDLDSDRVYPSHVTPGAPLQWLYYNGRWGDKGYRMEDDRQYRFAGQYHYVSGPLGPRFKNLGRVTICEGAGKCILQGSRQTLWPRIGKWARRTEDKPEDDDHYGFWAGLKSSFDAYRSTRHAWDA